MSWNVPRPLFAILVGCMIVLVAAPAAGQQSPRPRTGVPARPAENGPAQNTRAPNRAAANQNQRQPAPRQPAVARNPNPNAVRGPHVPKLTQEEWATLQVVLRAWEKQNQRISTFESDFTLYIYNQFNQNPNGQNQPAVPAIPGKVKYAAPDRGEYMVEGGEHWVCDGKSIHEFKAEQKQVVVHPLPPEMQGKAIVDGPLPFVFGAAADKLMHRYFMKVVTPEDLVGEQVWIDAWPKYRQDAANFSKVELILTDPGMTPFAVKMIDTNGKSSRVHIFTEPTINSPLAKLKNWIAPKGTPFGWERIEAPLPPPPGPAAQPPATAGRPAPNTRQPAKGAGVLRK